MKKLERDFRYLRDQHGDAGAREIFEKICTQLLHTCFGSDAHNIRVSQGDEGIDVLVGTFEKPIDNYQCKYFIDGLGNSQKQQVRESFKRAIEASDYKMKKWILCVPCTLSAKEFKWWSEWSEQQHKCYHIDLELYEGGYLISQLKKHDIYDQAFDNDLRQKLDEILAYIESEKGRISDGCNRDFFNAESTEYITFNFDLSFIEPNVVIDVISKEGVSKIFHSEYADCKADEFDTKTNNSIMKWNADGRKALFNVCITDRRIEIAKSEITAIDEKLEKGEELGVEEQIRYNNIGLLIRRFEHERLVKEKAVIVFLKDKPFHAYSHIRFFDLLDIIKTILDFPYRRGMVIDAEYHKQFSSFDVNTGDVQKEYRGHFVVDLPNAEVGTAYKRDDMLQFVGNYVCDWGVDMAKEIAIQYYVQYIGRQIVDHERPVLETYEYLNAKNTCICEWRIGPH